MSILRNEAGVFLPHFEHRRVQGTLSAVNAEVVLPLNGDNSALVYLNGTGTFNATYIVEGTVDGTNYFPLLAYPYNMGSQGGTFPVPAQPLTSEAVNAATVLRVLSMSVQGLVSVRVRLTAYTGGNCVCTMVSSEGDPLSPYARSLKESTLVVSAVGAVGAAVTATLPGVSTLRHYIDNITITRSATAALTASATPVTITTTNISGSLAFTLGQDAGGIGVDRVIELDAGSAGLGTLLTGTATTIVCPAYAGVIWRVNVLYRLGL